MTDKNYCMSSYLGLKYIEDGNINFSGKIRHCNYMPPADNERVLVKNAKELNRLLEEQITNYQDKKLGVFFLEEWIQPLLHHTLKAEMHIHSAI